MIEGGIEGRWYGKSYSRDKIEGGLKEEWER
jgi:hypothetical protein